MHSSGMSSEIADVVVVGAGPIGIEVHAALKAAGAAVRHVEAGAIGHTMTWWAPRTKFFSSPERISVCGIPLSVTGQDKATGDDYVRYLVNVARQLDLPVETFRSVSGVRRAGDAFEIDIARSDRGAGGTEHLEPMTDAAATETIHAKRVVLTIGNMHAPRRLGVPGEDLPHVSHYLADPNRYFGRRVVIVGGKNSAVEAAIRLYRVGAHVTIAYRRPAIDPDRVKPWLLPEMQWLIDKGRVGFEPSTQVERIDEDGIALTRDGTPVHVDADFVLLLTGYVQDQSLFDQLGLDRIDPEATNRPAYDHATMQTSVPGVYVAGTACGGSQQRARVFIENSHAHVDRICRAITGRGVPWTIDPEMQKLTEKHEER
ncbi:MAG: NAD(P)-binding domain-containing protein [Planctomycetota bacterium]